MEGSVGDIDLRLLRVFMTVVSCRGFAAAQSALNVSQANISMQMKQLEDRLGMRLCHRGRAGFWLTEEGKDVYESCQTLFRSLDEFSSSMAFSSGKSAGRLRISVIDNSIFNSTFQLHAAIQQFKSLYSNSEVMLYVVPPNEVEQMVFDGSCDLGIGFFPARRRGLAYHPVFTSTMNLYCANEHPLFDDAPDDLELEDVLSHEHAGRGYVSNAQLPTFERKFLVGASSSSVEGLATLVLSGKYTAYLPDHYAKNWTLSDTMRPILPNIIQYESLYELISKKGSSKNMLLDPFIECLTENRDNVNVKNYQIGTSI